MTGAVSLQPNERGYSQLTVHRKVTSVDPGFRIVSPAVVKVIFSASGPVKMTLTSSTDKPYRRAIIRVATNNSNPLTDGRVLRMTTPSVHPSSVPIGRAVGLGISIVNAG